MNLLDEQVVELCQKQLPLVKKVSEAVFHFMDEPKATEEGIEVGSYLIYPVEEILSSNMDRPMVIKTKWVVTALRDIPGSFNPWDGGSPPDVEETDLGTVDNIYTALTLIGTAEVQSHIDGIAENMMYDEMAEESRSF